MFFFLRFNGDHAEGNSCGSKSKNDDVCLHWETHVVQWEVARKKNAIFKVKIAFFLVLYIQSSAKAWQSLGCVVLAEPGRAWQSLDFASRPRSCR